MHHLSTPPMDRSASHLFDAIVSNLVWRYSYIILEVQKTVLSMSFLPGIAFSYFPAESDQGQFGMVTVDGNTVTTSDDFNRLATQYTNASGPNTPSQSDAGSTQFPSCPAQNSTFFASTTLPPTPNGTACSCVVNELSCQFTPQTSNTSILVGELLNTVSPIPLFEV